MTFVAISECETRLQWQGRREATLSGDSGPCISIRTPQTGENTVTGLWDPDALLIGAVEARTLLAFMEKARSENVEILFYQSSAVARKVNTVTGGCQYTDLIVRPHVAVRTKQDAETVRNLFARLPEDCFPGSVLRLTPRIEPVIDVWDAHPAAHPAEGSRRPYAWRLPPTERASALEP
jgi:organic hydroperoxide reductase OsmC/OhrA